MGEEYAIRLWKKTSKPYGLQRVPGVSAAKVVHVASGTEFACTAVKGGTSFTLPAGFKSDPDADVFRLVK